MFNRIIEILSLPIMLLNIIAGIVGGIWLAILGEWLLLGIGILLLFTAHWIISLLSIPSLPLVKIAEYFYKWKNPLGYLFDFLSYFYLNILIVATCFFAFFVCSSFYTDDIGIGYIPYMLWSWDMALGPWEFLVSKEPEDENSLAITVFCAAIFYFLFLISIFISPLLEEIIIIIFEAVQLIALPIFNVHVANRMEKERIRRIINPDLAETRYNLGVTYGELGRYNEAMEAYKQAIRINPDFAEAHYNMGVTYGELGRYSEAVEAYRQAIHMNPDFAEAHCNLGVTYKKLGCYSEAVEAYRQAIRINPDYAEAHCNLGVTYGKLGRHSESIDAFKQAIRINPDFAEAHYNLGVTYGKLGRHSESIDAFKQAIRINPDFAEAHYNLGMTYGELGRYTEAIAAYKQAIRINPDYAEAHYNLGMTYGELGRHTEEIAAYKQAIRINPDDAEAHYNLGMTYLILRDKVSALEEYMILKDLDRNRANELLNLIYE